MASDSPARRGQLDPSAIQCVGIIPAMHKRRIASAVRDVVTWLSGRNIRALVPTQQAEALGLPDTASDLDKLAECADLVLSMGGDGTFLSTARIAAPRGKPLMGINLGGFGFLASLPSGVHMLPALSAALEEKLVIQNRMMLRAAVTRGGGDVASFLALNDVVVGKGAFSRLFRMRTSVSGDPVSHFPADGMIVATPTGSTGYSLSAGGPIIDPDVRVIILTPICPHTLSARTLVVPAGRVIEMKIPDLRGAEINLTADGQEGFVLHSDDVVVVREAPFSARVVVSKDSSFYTRLHTKLGWGSHR
jgi:NAD+ kinase